ncbi:MAG TPA: glycoside hydrolase family 9 protein, partial [Puia sp.]|nr:glycoside hydrolase family 9 protein [Puia sp.]
DSPVIYINQVGFDSRGPKIAILQTSTSFERSAFLLINALSGDTVYAGVIRHPQQIAEWAPGKIYYQLDFSSFSKPGRYKLKVLSKGHDYGSAEFQIGEEEPAREMIGAIIHYYNKQRANTPGELAADEKLRLFGSDRTVDLHGGWCDASGDVSKYFSHLAYANFVSPQQTPLVTWSMVNADESIPGLLDKWGLRDSLEKEALWGADYMMRALSKDDYFYMIVFSYFNKDPGARRVVGLHANSVTTDEYQCAFREGGGMAIAALARISQWKRNGDYTSQQYLDAARRAFAHLVVNNTRYDDDGKENIIDDYCALMAATELWIATDSGYYREQARKRAASLADRMTDKGYFRAGETRRPFWHASDAGLPVVALARYLKKEKEEALRERTLAVIKQALDYNLRVTGEVSNPFGYARQTFLYKDSIKDGFFIPHENETGWWWQGENARLASLATAAIVGGRLVYPADKATGASAGSRSSSATVPAGPGAPARNSWGVTPPLATFASQQLSWILGCNPYSICFMYQFGKNNVAYMHSNFGHGSERGGISNGITGRDGNGDGSGIDFKMEAQGNEWRWTEQWIPHAAWFLQALTAIADE